METTLLATNTAMSLLTISKTLNPNSKTPLISHSHRHFSMSRPSQLAYARLNHIFSSDVRSLNRFGSVSLSRSLGGAVDLPRPDCLGSSADSFASGGGGFEGNDGSGGDGGGDGAAEGGEAKPAAAAAAAAAEDVSALSSDVIILDVGGMTCGGCAASVKRILEGQPQVSSASVNHSTDTAIVWPVSEAKVEPNWKIQLGEALANHLTTCGFKSKLRGEGANEGDTS